MCLISIKLFIVCTILCATVQTCTTYTTVTIRSFFLSAYNFFASDNTYLLDIAKIFKPRLFSLNSTHLHTRMTELLLFDICFIVCVLSFSRPLLRLNFYLYVMYTLIAFVCVALSLSISFILILMLLFLSAYNLFRSNNTYSLDLYSEDLQTTTVLFIRNASSHNTD